MTEAAPGEVVARSRLAVDPDRMWADATRLSAINAELMPWMRMWAPVDTLDAGSIVPGEEVGTCWLLLFGVVPVDRMRLRLLAFDPAKRTFHESSRLLTLRAWSHRRTVRAIEGGSEVEDRLEPRARLAALDPVVLAGVRALFAHRHRRLRARYGEVG